MAMWLQSSMGRLSLALLALAVSGRGSAYTPAGVLVWFESGSSRIIPPFPKVLDYFADWRALFLRKRSSSSRAALIGSSTRQRTVGSPLRERGPSSAFSTLVACTPAEPR
nr:hypothetical protein [Sphingomonas parva]